MPCCLRAPEPEVKKSTFGSGKGWHVGVVQILGH